MVVRALREVDVPVSIAVDFDILSSEQPLKNIVEAAGGDWSTVAKYWGQVNTAINSKRPELTSDEVKKDVQTLLATILLVNVCECQSKSRPPWERKNRPPQG